MKNLKTSVTVSLVIPSYNEIDAIPVVLKKVLDYQKQDPRLSEIIVVDDGSYDGSEKILERWNGIRVLRSKKSGGYGAALKKGFQAAQGDLILFMDMDDTYQISDLSRMIEVLIENNNDVVFGNRLDQSAGMPWVRFVGNKFYHYCLKALSLPRLTDPCTGMRLFRKELVSAFCRLPEDDLSYSMALTIFILSSKISYNEIQISYLERIGDSKLNSVIDGWRFFWVILKSQRSA